MDQHARMSWTIEDKDVILEIGICFPRKSTFWEPASELEVEILNEVDITASGVKVTTGEREQIYDAVKSGLVDKLLV